MTLLIKSSKLGDIGDIEKKNQAEAGNCLNKSRLNQKCNDVNLLFEGN